MPITETITNDVNHNCNAINSENNNAYGDQIFNIPQAGDKDC